MPARNRVTPTGEIVAVALRGAWLGNRGVLHEGHEIVRRHASQAWIICALAFRGWVAPRWEPRRWTALFFHDEAVALAAGHRPCALCRRADHRAFAEAVSHGCHEPVLRAPELDRRLHAERLVDRTPTRRVHWRAWAGLPAGAFVLLDAGPALVLDQAVVPWTTSGYGAAGPRPVTGEVAVLTPPTSVAALQAGYPVQIDATARSPAGPS